MNTILIKVSVVQKFVAVKILFVEEWVAMMVYIENFTTVIWLDNYIRIPPFFTPTMRHDK